MNDSAKATNSEIVKTLITIVQDFHDSRRGLVEPRFNVTVDNSNLVQNISIILHAHRRQQDRLADLMENMNRIVTGG
jgi:hypothetical protein